MKKYLKTSIRLSGLYGLILIAFSVFCMTACQEDEKVSVHPLVGTWYMSGFEKTACTEPENNESYILPCTSTMCFELKIYRDQTYQVNSIFPDEPGETSSGTYKIQGNNLEICEDNLYCSNGDFVISSGNNSFTLTETDGASGCISVSTFTRK